MNLEMYYMVIDVLSSSNYISVNISLCQVFGLNAAVYCSEIFNIYKKVQIKNKFIDGDYFKIDRKYIMSRTTLCIEDQLVIDHNLMKLDIIKKHPDNPDIMKFDFDKLFGYVVCEDKDYLDKVSEKVKTKTPRGTRESKRQRTIVELKDSIVCSNYELLTALRNWVDAIYASPHGYLSKIVIKTFQDGLNEYTQGDLDLALRLVKIATVQGYKNIEFAIHLYEKDQKIKDNKPIFDNQSRRVRVTNQKITTVDDVDGKNVF